MGKCCLRCRPRTKDMQKALVEPLQEIFSCNLHMMDIGMFVRGFMVAKWTENMSISQRSFRICNNNSKHRLETLPRCLVPLIEKCRRSEVVAVKVIRLHMSYVDKLLSDDPDIRLIHVVRDPRGLIESWKKLTSKRSRYSIQNMRLDAKIMCRRMLTECRIRRQLELKYPRRILLLRYEDLVTATDAVIGDIYSGLLQLALPSNVVDDIKQQMHAASDNGVTGTLRKNGTATATNWRRTINRTLLAYISDTCRPLLDELGYQL